MGKLLSDACLAAVVVVASNGRYDHVLAWLHSLRSIQVVVLVLFVLSPKNLGDNRRLFLGVLARRQCSRYCLPLCPATISEFNLQAELNLSRG